MSKRLIDLYPLQTAVQIKFGELWLDGFVIQHQHPAVWIQSQDGRRWFVTNGRHIRKQPINRSQG